MIGRKHRFAGGRVPDAYSLTFPQMLRYRAEHDGDVVGLAVQEYGIWHEWTWSEIWEECAALGEGLRALGVQRGQQVAFIGDPCLAGLLLTIAAQGIGVRPFGLYPTTPPEGVRFLLEDGEAACVVCEDQEFVDKVIDGGAAEGREIVVIDPKGMFAAAYEAIGQWDALRARGRELRASGSTVWDDEVAAGEPDDVCGIYYTSGTTGMPKGAELTHRNVMWGWPSPFYEDVLPGLGPQDRAVSDIPVASLAGPLIGIYFPLIFGLVAYIPDSDADQGEAMAEASPTFYLGFPRMWEVRASHTLVEIETSSRLHRALFAAGMAMRRYRMAADGRPGPLRTLAGWLGYLMIVRPMLDRWGLLRGRFILSGGAPLSPDLVRLWRLWGVTIRELYGGTESGGMCTIQCEPQPEAGTAGQAVPRTEIKIADDREILVRGPGVFSGYWKREEATREAFDDEGWLKTGDIGELREDGNLVVIDRKRDVLRMANGAEVPASSVEHVLKYSPYIRDALLVGEGKPALGALIEIDPDTVAQWARTKSVSYTGFTNLAQNEAVVQLVQDAIDEANDKLQERGSSVVTRFRILPKELDPEDPSEITATRKIRRRQLADKFSELVDEMFMTEETARIASHARGAELVSTSEEER